jgi:antibiotic biosynthesis monooxygenase (ABM) superfamily enzyme
VVYRFADAETQRAWETSAERAAWLARADELARETGTTHVSGLETWFALPGRTAPAPPRWKMAVVTFAAIYPLALLVTVVLRRGQRSGPCCFGLLPSPGSWCGVVASGQLEAW